MRRAPSDELSLSRRGRRAGTRRLRPLSSARLADGTTDRLRDAIVDGTLRPGERLVEDELAFQLDVSRAPVREALHRLEFENLVSNVPRRGRYVRVLSAHDAWEVYTLREALESIAVEQIVAAGGAQIGERLQSAVSQMRDAAASGDRKRLAQLDVQFHRLICEAAGHERLMTTWDSMLNQIRLLSREVLETQYDTLQDVPGRHQHLVDAMASGDAASARSEIRSHIESVGSRVIARLREQTSARPGAAVET